MPIHLTPPDIPHGPDGQGWNRLSVASCMTPIAQCALRPRDWTHYLEAQRGTVFSAWGSYGACIRDDGDCTACPVLNGHPVTLPDYPRLLVRVHPHDTCHAYLLPEDQADRGWAAMARRITWPELIRAAGWLPGARYSDEHGAGFWLERAAADAA